MPDEPAPPSRRRIPSRSAVRQRWGTITIVREDQKPDTERPRGKRTRRRGPQGRRLEDQRSGSARQPNWLAWIKRGRCTPME